MSQSLTHKILYVFGDYGTGQWTIAETKVMRSLCTLVNELLRFRLVIFFPAVTVSVGDLWEVLTHSPQLLVGNICRVFYATRA